jgi:hypothetical protein
MPSTYPHHTYAGSGTSLPEEYARWLSSFPWQWFVTLTFAYQVSDCQAHAIFQKYISQVEVTLHSPIIYVRGDEKRFSGCGLPGAPRHYHLVMASATELDCQWMRQRWEALAGKRQNGAGADFRPYKPELPGLAYIFKTVDRDGGDWSFRNLDLFVDQGLNKYDARARRRADRHGQRMKLRTHGHQTSAPSVL